MTYNEYNSCSLCPRKCGAQRNSGMQGFCGENSQLKVGRASLHMWEEPCISGENGSGTVFFSGCPLKCCYCQNYKLSRGNKGQSMTAEELCGTFLKLQQQGAHNINLVTAEHFAPHIREAVSMSRKKGLNIPVILNSSGYVTKETLEILENTVDVFLVDFKYMDAKLAYKYSCAADYPSVAKEALDKMVKMRGEKVFDENGLIKKGVIVRHLCLPTCKEDSKQIIKYIYENYGTKVGISIMSQYTPVGDIEKYDELKEKLSQSDYDSIINYCIEIGIEDAYIQEGDAADESFIPEFR